MKPNAVLILFIILQAAVAPAPPELTVCMCVACFCLVESNSHFVLIGNSLDRKCEHSEYVI